jgi:hypothetical protein
MQPPKLTTPVLNEHCIIISTVVINRSTYRTTIRAVSNQRQAPDQEQGYFVVISFEQEEWFADLINTELRWLPTGEPRTSEWVNSREMNCMMVASIAGEWEALRP